MKKILSFLLVTMMLLSFFTGCSTKNEIPDVVKNMKGGEKWETKIDYANTDNWLAINDTGKDVDVIYFYPTTFTKASDDAPNVADIDDAGMRADAQRVLTLQASVFEEDCNIYAPYYRQVSAPYALSLSDEDSEALLSYSASQDPTAALDYYFKHYNNGKPFILAGHSQGSQVVITLLAGYMEEHPEYYKNMIAAYAIGYSVTEEYLLANPHLKFAEGADDTGIIVSYNTEGPGNKDKRNGVVKEGAISINPINWKRDETYAGISENKGSFVMGNVVEGLADAKVDLERGVIVCESVDPSIYAIAAPGDLFFGPESYHLHDYGLYYFNLRENVKERIAAFMR